MSGRVIRKWRPSLVLVIGGTLLVVLMLPILGLTVLRLAGNILGWAETAWLIGWIAVVATLVLAWLLWRLVLRPVWALTEHAQAMKAGRDVPAPDRFGTAELSDLGRSVIEMGTSLHARARGLGAYADHVTHELKSPLTSIRGAAEMLSDPGLSAEDRASLVATIETSAKRMDRLLGDLRAHAAARLTAEQGHCTVAQAVHMADLPAGLSVNVQSQTEWPMSAHDLGRVLTQLGSNARQAGATTLTLQDQIGGLLVSDDGPGIAKGDRTRIFDPFFTTHRASGGTGMGLSIAQALVEAVGGRIQLAETMKGAGFFIEF